MRFLSAILATLAMVQIGWAGEYGDCFGQKMKGNRVVGAYASTYYLQAADVACHKYKDWF